MFSIFTQRTLQNYVGNRHFYKKPL